MSVKGRKGMQKKTKLRNSERAVDNTKIVTIKDGRRIIRRYTSGEALDGALEQNNAPPFTGYVRGFGRKRK